MRKLLGLGLTLAVAGALACGFSVPVGAQTAATWSFETVSAGTNTPDVLGTLGSSFVVWSDDGLVSATFQTITESTQFGIHDNNAVTVGDDPMSGNVLFGGRTNYPDASAAHGKAAITVTFSQAITDLAFDFLTASADVTGAGATEWLTIDLGGGSTYGVRSFTQNSTGYYYQENRDWYSTIWGYQFAPTTALTFWVEPGNPDNLYAEFGLDNLKVKYAGSTVPEPGALALLAGLALPVGWLLKRRAA